MQCIRFLSVMIALSLSTTVYAAIYEWRDDSGVSHFTDNADSIPARFVKRAKESPSDPAEAKKETPTASPAPSSTPLPNAGNPVASKPGNAKLGQELKRVKQSLSKKKEELEKLHHKWSVARGRTPTQDEVKEFEKKLASGKVTPEDNPYVNRSALSLVGAARAAYYQKLEEIRKDEERLSQLERETQALEPLTAISERQK